VESLETELERARALSVEDLADAIESIGFECTRCGACCKGYDPDPEDGDASAGDGGESDAGDGREPHTATVFPDEVREIRDGLNGRADAADDRSDAGDEAGAGGGTPDQAYDWRDVARPMPYGLSEGADGPEGETFEWALAVDDCGDCTFYDPGDGEEGTCTVYGDRPLVCRTYPFSVAVAGVGQPMGEVVDSEGPVRAHECEGLGREIDREEAVALAETLKERAVREIEEAIAVRESYAPVDAEGVVVHDSEGAKRPDGSPVGEG